MEKQQTVYLTQEGLEDLRSELQFLRTKERARIAQDIAEARTQGDLSENAEYDAAKEAQGLLEAKIAKMEQVISNARIVDESQIDTSKAYILSKVRVKNLKTGMEQSYQLVSQREANLAQGRISVNSPIGKGLLGQEVGAVIDIVVPAGKVQLKILEISR
jgi:transcription elongation factor GreA